jgi:hypothetical protein
VIFGSDTWADINPHDEYQIIWNGLTLSRESDGMINLSYIDEDGEASHYSTRNDLATVAGEMIMLYVATSLRDAVDGIAAAREHAEISAAFVASLRERSEESEAEDEPITDYDLCQEDLDLFHMPGGEYLI